MSDDLRRRLHEVAESLPVDRGDTLEVVRSGRRRAWGRRALVAGVAAIVALGAPTAVRSISDHDVPAPPAGTDRRDDVHGATEDPGRTTTTERERAEIFAFRALAETGLMRPLAERTYNFTYADDTTRTGDGWRIGFAASDCSPQGDTFTCSGLSGEDPESGNALTDSFLTVRLEDGRWTVVAFDGNVRERDRRAVVGYSLPQRDEPAHWEFPAVGAWPASDGVMLEAFALWVGPYPTSERGSVCEVVTTDAGGDPIETVDVFYVQAPDREFERAGWVRVMDSLDDGVAGANFRCEQYTGPAWRIASEPVLLGDPGEATGAAAELEWRGHKGFTMSAVCRATLVDDDGDVVWEGTAEVPPAWRRNELRTYPYRTTAEVYVRSHPVDAVAVGDFSCDSL